MPAPFFMVGPTAVGKSGLAVEVAARCGAEIVGADAFQVYAGFDLLTAKPTADERARVPHHLVGTVSPTETYNVARYLQDARSSLDALQRRGKPALVVGGTGLYVKALTHGLSPLPEADPALRAELDILDSPALFARLRALDPAAARAIDGHNKRRLVRAVEVCLLAGKPFSSYQTLWGQSAFDPGVRGVLLIRPKADLDERIERRTQSMFDQGVVEEVRSARGTSLSATAARMIGWQDVQDYLDGRQTLAECRRRIVIATRQYAKRQVTWFQRESYLERLDLSTLSDEQATMLLCARVSGCATQTPLDGGALRN